MGGLQSDRKQPSGRTVPPPESLVPGKRWEWLENIFTMFDKSDDNDEKQFVFSLLGVAEITF